MRLTICLRLAAFVAMFGLIAFALPAQDQGSDDVAAAARKAREQQKNAPKPKKVLTNDDIPSVKADGPAPSTDAAKGGDQKDATQANAKSPEDDPKSEKYWRSRFQKLRDKQANAEKELDVLQRELEKAQVQYYPDPQKALAEQHDRTDIDKKTAAIDAKKKEIEDIKQQISDLEDQLRQAGGDPGWAR